MKILGIGVDIVEIGMPFSDPMADGPTIQLSRLRAIKKGSNLKKYLEFVNNLEKKMIKRLLY